MTPTSRPETQRWFLLIHGKVQQVPRDHYLTEAKRGQWMGITRKDGSEPTWDDFNAFLSRALGDTDKASPTAQPPRPESVTQLTLGLAL